jgi:hypothetical protein
MRIIRVNWLFGLLELFGLIWLTTRVIMVISLIRVISFIIVTMIIRVVRVIMGYVLCCKLRCSCAVSWLISSLQWFA